MLKLHENGCWQGNNYIFTTEGHVIPVLREFHDPSQPPAQLQQLPKQPASPMQSPHRVQTVVVSPDQP